MRIVSPFSQGSKALQKPYASYSRSFLEPGQVSGLNDSCTFPMLLLLSHGRLSTSSVAVANPPLFEELGSGFWFFIKTRSLSRGFKATTRMTTEVNRG